MTAKPRTLFDKIWESHVVNQQEDGTCLIYIDRQLIHEVTSPQAFEGLRMSGRKVRRPDATLAVADHNVPTTNRKAGIKDETSRIQVETLEHNCKEFDITYFALDDARQGIVHIVGPEEGFTQPGMTIVCGDSHTSTHGAFGALAFGIGTSEVEHVLATQTLIQKRAKNMRIHVEGDLSFGVTAKDLILAIIAKIGTAGGTGYVIEYTGKAIRDLSMEGRMTICNMSIEAGARAGLISPDETTFAYIKGRPMAPKAEYWEQAVAFWKTLPSDEGAQYDKEVVLNAAELVPQVSWGTSPQDVLPITASVPNPEQEKDADKRTAMLRALEYMGLTPGTRLQDVSIDKVFIGSCTNGRIEDLRQVASVVKGHKVAPNVILAMVVPGSGLVKKQAEQEGLDKIFVEAGFEWRDPGCSMCLAMNADRLEPGERCASTSNRNFEGRQGRGGRTHLVGPEMAAAAAIKGKLADAREFMKNSFTQDDNAEKKTKTIQGLTMQSFTTFTAIAAPMPLINIDTDMIIPKQFLKTIKRTGLGKNLFDEMRFTPEGKEIPDFVLNKPAYRKAGIIVAGDNFGCGSSREHAPWALLDFGIRCIIAPSFADIFYNNCFKNGMLPIRLPKEQVNKLLDDAERGANAVISVDLEKQEITGPDGGSIHFDIDPFRKKCLLEGLDDIGLTLVKKGSIDTYENALKKDKPWLFS